MKCLVVVDMQNDFITGPLGTKEAQEIVPKVAEKIKNFDGYIIFTQDTHNSNYLETQEGKILPIPHCLYNTDGWEIESNILSESTLKHTDCIYKSSFGSEILGAKIRELDIMELKGITDIEIVGVCTDICVISNALILKSFLPKIKITIDASCCAGTSPEAHNIALKAMRQCQISIENWKSDEG